MQITRKLIISSTLWASAAKGSVMLINLFVLPLFIKNMGAELYGIWVLSGVLLGYAGIFDFGFTQGLQKYVAEARVTKDEHELSKVVVTGTVVLLTIGISLGIFVYCSAPVIVGFFSIEQEQAGIAVQLLRIGALFSVFMWPLRICDVVLNSCMRIKELSILSGIKAMTQSVIMLVMVFNVCDIIYIKWVVSSVVLVLSLYGIVLLLKYVPEISWRPSYFCFSQILKMQRFSLGMFAVSLLALISVKIDAVIVGKMLSMEMLVVYVIIAKPFEVINQIGAVLMSTLLPVAYNMLPQANDREKEELICKAIICRTVIVAPITAVSIWATPSFIELWVGSDYVQYAFWAQLFVAVHFFLGLKPLANVGRIAGAMRLVNYMMAIKVFVNLVSSILFVRVFGIGGVILGTVFSNLVFGELLFGTRICKVLRVRWLQILKSFGLCVALPLLATLAFLPFSELGMNWFGLLGCSALLYVLVLGCVLYTLKTMGKLDGIIKSRA